MVKGVSEAINVHTDEMKALTNPDYNRSLFDSFSFRLKQAKNALWQIQRMEKGEDMKKLAKKALDILEPGWQERV